MRLCNFFGAFSRTTQSQAETDRPEDWEVDQRSTVELMRLISSGESFHPAIVPLAARWLGQGMHPGATVNSIRELMEEVPVERRDSRWQVRFNDVPRIVETAKAKFHKAEQATEGRDPLDGVVERTAADPGAPFQRDALERLARLKKEDSAAFERLRGELKKAGCRMAALDEAIAETNEEPGQSTKSQASVLTSLAQSATLFHAPDWTTYADIEINGHRETWRVRRARFQELVSPRFF